MSTAHALVNGRACDSVSILDRGLQFGDGVFETAAVDAGQPLLLAEHLERLRQGCDRLGITLEESVLLRDISAVCRGTARGVLKVIITRGSGGRGYTPPSDARPTRIVAVHPWPQFPPDCAQRGIAVGLCRLRLASQPQLAGLKHLNRLEQILARREWREDWQEGLLLGQDDRLVEATGSNVFLVRNDATVHTPRLSNCGVAGVMRAALLEHQEAHGVSISESELSALDLVEAREIFLTNSLIGLWPVASCDGRHLAVGPIAQRLQEFIREQNWAVFA